jgi:hypothetical protein
MCIVIILFVVVCVGVRSSARKTCEGILLLVSESGTPEEKPPKLGASAGRRSDLSC